MEELKLILQTVSEMGQLGAWVFGIYLGKQLIVSLLIFVAALVAIKTARQLISDGIQADKNSAALKDIAKIVGLNIFWHEWSEKRAEIIERVASLVQPKK